MKREVFDAQSLQSFIAAVLIMTAAMTCCEAAGTICPESSSNCSTRGYDAQYVYHMTCGDFGVQSSLPDACPYSLIVRELTFEPETSVIRTLPARAFDGLRVRKLVMSGVGVETVHESAFVWLADDLQELSLDDNLLTTLPDRVFSRLTNLVHLQLQNNRLTTIGKNLLDGLSRLLVLDLSGNRISSVDLEAWRPIPALSTLRLRDNIIDGSLNSTRLRGLGALQELQLDGNFISDVTSEALRALPNLRSFSVSRNRLQELPENVFASNSQLEEVDASENQIVGLERNVFNETKRLTTLALEGNRIDELPIYVFRHMYNLRTLRLQRNYISAILSNSLSGLSSLRHLDLSDNRMSSLPLGIFDPLGLVNTLLLSGNRISVIARDPFESMRNLAALDFSDNLLVSVGADWFRTTSGLAELHLDGNRLKTIQPEAFGSLRLLRELRLNDNLLSDVDGGLFVNCSSLQYLDLSSNPLRQLQHAGTTFAGLTALRRMNLTGTCLTEVSFGGDSAASSLAGLQELDLSTNALQNLTESMFLGVPGLRRLHLSANDIEVLNGSTFSMLSRLELLDLSSNALGSIDQKSSALLSLPSSTMVDLSWNLLTSVDDLPTLLAGVYLFGNPLRCDCNSTSRLLSNPTRVLDADLTACLNLEIGRPEILVCYWTNCSATSSGGAVVTGSDCSAPEASLSYLEVPRRRPAVICPWDAVPPGVQNVIVDIISTTMVHVQWNLTVSSNVTITISVISGVDSTNASGEVYEMSANVTAMTIGNLTSGGSYSVCVTTDAGDRACVVITLPVELSSTASPTSLQLRMSATPTDSALRVTWDLTTTSGHADVAHFRLTWRANGTSTDVTGSWIDSSNTSHTISGLLPSTVYAVCVQAVTDADNSTVCEFFSTLPAVTTADSDNTMLIIIIAASVGGFLLLLLLLIIICCCCCRRRHDDESDKPRVTVRPVESTRSVNRGRLAEHSTVSMSVYENVP